MALRSWNVWRSATRAAMVLGATTSPARADVVLDCNARMIHDRRSRRTRHGNQTWARRLILLAIVLVGSACGGSPTNPTPPPTGTRIISLDGDMTFGTIAVGSSAEATLRISNSGTEALTVIAMTWPTGGPTGGVYSSSWTSGTIAAGSSQTVTMRFTPSGDVSYNGTLTITANHTSGTNTIPISGTGDAGAVYADLTGFYDLNAVITDSDPIWGPTDGAREVAVLKIEHSPNSSQFVGTFAEFQFIDPDGKASAGQKGIVRGSTSLTGQVVIELLHEGRNCHWYGEGRLGSGRIVGRFGDACHMSGTFTAERKRTE